MKIYSLFIQSSDKFYSDLKFTQKQPHPQCTDQSGRLCILETLQPKQEQSQQFVFMAAQCSFVSQYVLNIQRTCYMVWLA